MTVLINQRKQERTKHHGLFPPAPASCKSYVQGDSVLASKRLPAEFTFRHIPSQNDTLQTVGFKKDSDISCDLENMTCI